MESEEITILMIKPNENLIITTIKNDLDSLRKAVSIGADYQGLIEIFAIDAAGMEYFIGIRYVDKFKTHPVTSKRDYLSLQNDKSGYFSADENGFYCANIGESKTAISETEIVVANA